MYLEKVKQIFQDFQISDFNIFDTITLLKWETEFDYIAGEEHKILSLTMASFNGYRIEMEFVNINSLRFCGNGQISGFYIRDMSSRGYEGSSKYEVGDYENDEIQFYCCDVIIKSLEKINP